MQGYKIPFQVDPIQFSAPHSQKTNVDRQSALVNQEIRSMLPKGAIQKVSHVSGEILKLVSAIFYQILIFFTK